MPQGPAKAGLVSATGQPLGPHYKWIALSNTTLGILMATINSSIVMIALPDIFRGIKLNPLTSGNSPYFLWLLMGYMVVTAVLVVSLGRIGDMYGRVRMYTLGFAIFTIFSILLSITWGTGSGAALYLIAMRIFQGGRGRSPVGQLLGDSDRRVPLQPARAGARHQHGGGHRRFLHRAGARGTLGAPLLAPGLPGIGAVRDLRHGLGLHQAA